MNLDLWAAILFQISTYQAAKDWLVVTLISVIAGLIGAAWMDLKGKLKAVEARLDAKVEADKLGYERLTRCEERLDALRAGRRGGEG